MSEPKLYFYNNFFLIFLLITLFFNLFYSQQLCNPNDKNVLLRIKNYWGNPASLSYWDPNVDCCEWDHLQCDDVGHVTTFRVSQADDIHGQIPPNLDQLTSLNLLQFDGMPNLSGPIPSYIGKLKNLTMLVIAGTNVGGSIPKLIGELTNLVRLELAANKHKGHIPSFLSKLKSLNELDLSSNELMGSIPLPLGQLSSLSTLTLSYNKLSGPIPDFLAQKLKKLNTLYFQGNQLSGPIPLSLGRNPNLEALTIGDNKLTGDASFLLDKKNTGLKYLDIRNNLIKFDFSKVHLSRNIINLQISHNMIYGSLPLNFGLIDPLAVDVSYNQLCGPIPNGRRFKRASPDAFAHNKCLCGGPLPPCKTRG